MAKNFIIVESPTKAKTIAKFLGKEFSVQSSFGHIRDLPKSKMGVDVKNDFEPTYVIPKAAKKRIENLKKLAENAKELYFATDEDREGESIAWHLPTLFKIQPKTSKRIVFHEITKDAIQKALQNPRAIDLHLVNAQQARRILDRLVGYELSPFLWKKIRRGLSAGRVQSIAVRLIVEREREIQQFRAQEYWSLEGVFQTTRSDRRSTEKKITKHKSPDESNAETAQVIRATLIQKDGKRLEKFALKNQEAAEAVRTELLKAQFHIHNIQEKETKKSPAPPFTTSTLQQEANKRLGFSSKQTMMIAQQLYEGVSIGERGTEGLITYMRTDSVHLADKFLQEASTFIQQNFGVSYVLTSPRRFKVKQKLAQEAHEAIRPTEVTYTPDNVQPYLTREQFKLYDLIWRRALATQIQEARLRSTSIDIADQPQKYILRATGTVIAFDGYLKLYPEANKETILPKVEKSQTVFAEEMLAEQHFTQPLARYNDAMLVKTLEEYGIGRPSTYAPTISTIIERGYVQKEEKRFVPTEIGMLVNDLLVQHFPNIVDYKFTANLEDDLDAIADGKKEWKPIIKNFYEPFKQHLMLKEKEIDKKKLVEQATDEVCEKCGKPMVIKLGRFGKFLACTGYPECRNTQPFSKEEQTEQAQNTGETCEKCGKALVVKTGRFGKFLGCSGYPDCKYVKKIEKSTGVQCPQCGKGEIVEKRSRKGRTFYSCNTYPNCTFALWSKPTGEKCSACASLIVFGRDNTYVCSNQTCKNTQQKTKK